MSFDLLSNELIAEIFKHLHQSDCLRLSLCCHGFRDVVEPFLYGEFVQRKKGDLALFLRSLIEKPARAKYLKHFTGSMITSDAYRIKEPGEFDLSAYLGQPSHHQWILNQLPKTIFWPSRIKTWEVHLYNDIYWDPICAFILWICSDNLQSIKIHSYGVEIADSINYLFQQVRIATQNPALPSPFPKLRRVELSEDQSSQWISVTSIFPYLELDTVKEFVGSQIATEVFLDDSMIPDRLRLNTESLALTSSEISSSVMVKLCLCFEKLRRFSYDHSSFSSTRTERLWPSSVRKGLQNSKHCLEELVLSAKTERWNPIPARPEYLLGLGKDFECLGLLDVSSRALFGTEFDNSGTVAKMLYDLDDWNGSVFSYEYMLDYLSCQLFVSSLPPKLECLIIRECTAAIYNFLGVLVFGHESRTGALKRLKLEFWPRFQPGNWTEKPWYREAVRRGIEVELIYLPLIPSSRYIALGR